MILLSVIRDHFVHLRLNLSTEDKDSLGEKISKRINQLNNLIFLDSADDVMKRRLVPNHNDAKFFEMATYNLD